MGAVHPADGPTAVPVVFQTYDLLEKGGVDQRQRPLVERRRELEKIIADLAESRLRISQIVAAATWESLARLHLTGRSGYARHPGGIDGDGWP
jgi:ATP-dependent DNA ligase